MCGLCSKHSFILLITLCNLLINICVKVHAHGPSGTPFVFTRPCNPLPYLPCVFGQTGLSKLCNPRSQQGLDWLQSSVTKYYSHNPV